MNLDWQGIAVAFLLGGVLGAGYVALLWASVRSLAGTPRPFRRLLGGVAIRLGLVLGSFYLIMDGQWDRLIACLLGFLVARVATTAWVGLAPAPGSTR